MKFLVGVRGSKLALAQTEHVIGLLKKKFPELIFEKKIIKTTGDKITDAPLAKIGGKGLFVKEIDEAVANGSVDFAVHSMKDVPTEMHSELKIAAMPEREEVSDVLISKDKLPLEKLPTGTVIGTSSLRRKAEILNYRNDFVVKDLRGNVDTRLKKLKSGEYGAITLAKAGLKRLGLDKYITQDLPAETFIPSVGQGAVAVVSRKDSKAAKFLSTINHKETEIRITAERAILKRLGGGCQVPIGALAEIVDSILRVKGVVLSPDGRRRIETYEKGSAKNPEKIGIAVAQKLLEKGADVILKEVYG